MQWQFLSTCTWCTRYMHVPYGGCIPFLSGKVRMYLLRHSIMQHLKGYTCTHASCRLPLQNMALPTHLEVHPHSNSSALELHHFAEPSQAHVLTSGLVLGLQHIRSLCFTERTWLLMHRICHHRGFVLGLASVQSRL